MHPSDPAGYFEHLDIGLGSATRPARTQSILDQTVFCDIAPFWPDLLDLCVDRTRSKPPPTLHAPIRPSGLLGTPRCRFGERHQHEPNQFLTKLFQTGRNSRTPPTPYASAARVTKMSHAPSTPADTTVLPRVPSALMLYLQQIFREGRSSQAVRYHPQRPLTRTYCSRTPLSTCPVCPPSCHPPPCRLQTRTLRPPLNSPRADRPYLAFCCGFGGPPSPAYCLLRSPRRAMCMLCSIDI